MPVPGCAEERVGAVIRSRIEIVGAVRVRDADDAGIAGGISRGLRAIVARRRDHHDVVVPRVVDGGLQGGAEARVAEREVDDVRAVIDGPDDAFDDVAVLPEPVRVEHGHRHDLDADEADARDADAVARPGGDDAGHGRSVAVGIARRRRPGDEAGAGHQPAGEVGMRGVDTGVQHGDDRRAGGVDGAVDVVPADAPQRPLAVVAGIVGRGLGLADAIALDMHHVRAGTKRVDDARAGGHANDRHAQRRDRVDGRRACPGQDVCSLGGVRAGREGHHVVVGRDRGGRRGRRLGGGGRCRRGRLRGRRVGAGNRIRRWRGVGRRCGGRLLRRRRGRGRVGFRRRFRIRRRVRGGCRVRRRRRRRGGAGLRLGTLTGVGGERRNRGEQRPRDQDRLEGGHQPIPHGSSRVLQVNSSGAVTAVGEPCAWCAPRRTGDN